jgi:hypothetical protein
MELIIFLSKQQNYYPEPAGKSCQELTTRVWNILGVYHQGSAKRPPRFMGIA